MILLYLLHYLIIIYYVYGERKGGGVGVGWSDAVMTVRTIRNSLSSYSKCTSNANSI